MGLDVLGGLGGAGGIAGLAQPLAALVQRLINMSAGQIYVVSGRRSRAQQEALYAQYLARGKAPPVVARPGTSQHERGRAVDLGGPYGLMHRLARQLGLIFPVRGEPWHAQLGPGRSYYATGGIVRDTGPAFVHRGEGVFTPAQMRVLGAAMGDSASSGPSVYINNMPIYVGAGATETDGRRVARGFLDTLAQRRVMVDARIA
jgi:hypothetical protein